VIALAALSPPLAGHTPAPGLPVIGSSPEIALTSFSWGRLFSDIGYYVNQDLQAAAGNTAAGFNPLPANSNPIAPIAQQVVLDLAHYGDQLLAGQGGQIPGEISGQLSRVTDAVSTWGPPFSHDRWGSPLENAQRDLAEVVAFVTDDVAHKPYDVLLLPAVLLDEALKWSSQMGWDVFNLRNAIATALAPAQPATLQAAPTASIGSSTPAVTSNTPTTTPLPLSKATNSHARAHAAANNPTTPLAKAVSPGKTGNPSAVGQRHRQ
jgi:hypothetical protein